MGLFWIQKTSIGWFHGSVAPQVWATSGATTPNGNIATNTHSVAHARLRGAPYNGLLFHSRFRPCPIRTRCGNRRISINMVGRKSSLPINNWRARWPIYVSWSRRHSIFPRRRIRRRISVCVIYLIRFCLPSNPHCKMHESVIIYTYIYIYIYMYVSFSYTYE